MSELGPNAHGEMLDPGRVIDCHLALPLPLENSEELPRVLVVAPLALLHPAVPQPAGSLLYELATGHPDRQSRDLVVPADLTQELRAWPRDTAAPLTAELTRIAAAVVSCWQRGDLRALDLPLEPGEDARALTRAAMTLARVALRMRLDREVTRARCRCRADEPFL